MSNQVFGQPCVMCGFPIGSCNCFIDTSSNEIKLVIPDCSPNVILPKPVNPADPISFEVLTALKELTDCIQVEVDSMKSTGSFSYDTAYRKRRNLAMSNAKKLVFKYKSLLK